MEPTHPTPSPDLLDAPPAAGELVVQNGRLNGTRRALNVPLTLIGQAVGCQVRLNVEGVSPLHCALIHGPQGVLLRDLQSSTGTRVNGVPVATCVLHNDDLLTVGPFRFRIRLPETPATAAGGAAETALDLQREKDALRIQAAAVAAQQAALTEEEARLQQRRIALEQQEKQLAAHLEDKRRQLLQLHEEIRQARSELLAQRKTHEERIGAAATGLAQERRELEDSRRRTRVERNRLIDLRRRLKQRWHRHWMAERKVQRRREEELAGQRRELEKEGERLQQHRAALAQDRLRFNGERELGRRQLQADREQWRLEDRQAQEGQAQHKAELQERSRQLDQRQAQVTKAERDLEEQKRRWQGIRLHLEKEAEGLEIRICNHRRKILDQEQEVIRLDAVIRSRTVTAAEGATGTESAASKAPDVPSTEVSAEPSRAPALPNPLELEQRECRLGEAEADVQQRLTALEKLAGELADQRLHLAEQWQRLLQAREHWQQEHGGATAELETAAQRLQEREQALAARERGLGTGECELRQRLDEVIHLRHNLEGCQARLRTRVADWEGERERLLIEVRSREELVERRMQAMAGVRGRWEKQRRQELTRVQAALTAAENARQDHSALCEEWLRRKAALERQERDLAEKTLALEQYRQECIGQGADSPAVEKRLEALRRRWAALSTAVERTTARERQALHTEVTRFEGRCRQFHLDAQEVAARDTQLANLQAAWEQEKSVMQDTHDQIRQEVQTLRAQRRTYESQLEVVRDEVERIARLLLDENDTAMEPVIIQAA